MDSAFGYGQAFVGNFFGELQRGVERDFECAQIAAVDADQVTAGVESALEFLLVVGFAEDVEMVRARAARKRDEFFLIERGYDEQDSIGRVCPGFDDLKFVDDEILAQARKRGGR